jgi:hypothetical protein
LKNKELEVAKVCARLLNVSGFGSVMCVNW